MRFRLTYDGSLKSAGRKNRPEEKWDIRKTIQPQLAELWEVHPALQGYLIAYPRSMGEGGVTAREASKKRLQTPVTVDAHRFVPLVRSSLLLTCTLDILFLRKDSPGAVVSDGGDLDNRIKTLFDGLRMPLAGEVAAGGDLTADPFHCLLEDDKLVSSLTVRTDRLLSRPGASSDEVRLIIDVTVSPTRIEIETNSGFVAD
jgi:hypothetical protein